MSAALEYLKALLTQRTPKDALRQNKSHKSRVSSIDRFSEMYNNGYINFLDYIKKQKKIAKQLLHLNCFACHAVGLAKAGGKECIYEFN